jgi:Pilus formation protein N terminal region
MKCTRLERMACLPATIRTHGFLFAVTLLLIPISLAWAADQTIILRLGAGSPLLLERPFKTVLIGDRSVVDVLTQSDRSVILLPLNLVATNIIFLDETSIAITNVRILVYKTSASRIHDQDVANELVTWHFRYLAQMRTAAIRFTAAIGGKSGSNSDIAKLARLPPQRTSGRAQPGRTSLSRLRRVHARARRAANLISRPEISGSIN